MDDKLKNVVSAAVIKAIADNGSDFLADKTAEILNAPADNGLGSYFGMLYAGNNPRETSYLETLLNEQVRASIKEAVNEWFDLRRDELRASIISSINAENMADAYLNRLGSLMEGPGLVVSVAVEIPRPDDDDD